MQQATAIVERLERDKLSRLAKERACARRGGDDDAMTVEAEAVSIGSGDNGGARSALSRSPGLPGACATAPQREAS